MYLVYSTGRFLRFIQSNSLVEQAARFHISSKLFLPSHRSVPLWNSALESCIEDNNSRWVPVLFRQMLQSNVKPNDFTFSLLIKATSSSSLDSQKEKLVADQIQTHLIKSGVDRFVYVTTALLDLYAKSGCIFFAHQVFEGMPFRDLVSWNALISGFSLNEYDFEALEIFIEMLKQGISPCQITLISVIPSCAQTGLLDRGKSIHGFGVKAALDLDSRVKNALTSMYAKCMDLDAARLIFDGMSEKTAISWNTMIGAYGQNGHFEVALHIFKQMHKENVGANSVTIVSLLSANAHLDSTHSYAIKTGLDTNASVITSLVCTYARCGKIASAELLYGSMTQKNLISLTAIISSYAEKGNIGSAVGCFTRMLLADLKADAVAMVSILHGFTNPSQIGVGVAFHGYGIKTGLYSDTLVVNGLIGMYTKFGDIDGSFALFLEMHERPLISWNSMISCFVQAGRATDAMKLFHEMIMSGNNPDAITMASILSGCSLLGSLRLGRKLHNYILRNNQEVEDFVGTALIDMYAKCGNIESAERVFRSIGKPCLASWNTMILSYGLCGMQHEALQYYSDMLEQGLEPDDITFLGVLSACTHAGLVDEGRSYFRNMEEDFGVNPGLQHCACMVDLLGRAGLLDEAVMFVKNMEIEPDLVVLGAMLGACCIHQDIKLGECLAKQIYLLDYRNDGFYVLMSNLYASAERWDDVVRVREMMREAEGSGCSGTSLVEVSCSNFLQVHQSTKNSHTIDKISRKAT